MGLVRRDRARRWSLVLVLAGVLAATPALVGARPAAGSDTPAADLVRQALGSEPVAFQGLVQVDGRLGLPVLPVQSSGLTLLDHSTRIRVWWASPGAWRTDLLSAGGQQGEFATADGTRQWDYEQNTVDDHIISGTVRLPRAADLLPPAAARSLLAWITPDDRVTRTGAAVVAGRSADGLRVEPGDARSSVGRLDVWVDPVSALPLRLDVYARGAGVPVFSTQFMDVSYDRPDATLTHPAMTPTAHYELSNRRDLLAFVADTGKALFPSMLGSLPALTGVGLPAGIATYGSGFARVALVELPPRFAPRVIDSLGSTPTAAVAGGRLVVLGSAVLQVAVLQPNSGGTVLLAGTLTPAAFAETAAVALRELDAAGVGR